MVTEILRSFSVRLSFLLPQLLMSFYFADRILVANRDTALSIPRLFRWKTADLLETAIDETSVVGIPEIQNQNTCRLIWIGRLDKRKGCEVALLGFRDAWLKNPAISLTIIGSGPESSRMKSMIQSSGLSNAVDIIEKIPKRDIAKTLKDHDVFLFTSMRDTSGNVLLEAMSMALPVITLNHQGASYITTSETAVRLPLGNAANVIGRVAAAINMMAESPVLRHEMGCAGRIRILAHFTWDIFTVAMDGYYREALDHYNKASRGISCPESGGASGKTEKPEQR
jgi:glycosyltransferase involved in cell wall biosynthesis